MNGIHIDTRDYTKPQSIKLLLQDETHLQSFLRKPHSDSLSLIGEPHVYSPQNCYNSYYSNSPSPTQQGSSHLMRFYIGQLLLSKFIILSEMIISKAKPEDLKDVNCVVIDGKSIRPFFVIHFDEFNSIRVTLDKVKHILGQKTVQIERVAVSIYDAFKESLLARLTDYLINYRSMKTK